MRSPIDQSAAKAAFDRAIAEPTEEFGNFFLARLMGLQITYPDGACDVTFTVQDFMYNPQGTLHGGMLTTALDISMGHLLRQVAGPGATLEFKVQFLAAMRSGAVTCRATVLRQGKSICFMRSEATNESGEVIAFATSTWSLIRPKPAA